MPSHVLGRLSADSDYEKQRAANIHRNESFLQQLGLFSAKLNNKPKKSRANKPEFDPVPSRASSRLQNVPRPDYIDD